MQLSERAKELGLEPMALKIINNPACTDLSSCVKSGEKGLESLNEVHKGIGAIIADMAAKHERVIEQMRVM